MNMVYSSIIISIIIAMEAIIILDYLAEGIQDRPAAHSRVIILLMSQTPPAD